MNGYLSYIKEPRADNWSSTESSFRERHV